MLLFLVLRSSSFTRYLFFLLSIVLFCYFFLIGIKNIFRYNAFCDKYETTLLSLRQAYQVEHDLTKTLMMLEDLSFLEYSIKKRLSFSYHDEHVYLFF